MQLGFDSLWVFDRLLYPVKPIVPYPAGDGSLPELYERRGDWLFHPDVFPQPVGADVRRIDGALVIRHNA